MVAFKVADDRNAYGNRWKKWTTRIILPISSSFLSSSLYIFFVRIDFENHFPFLEYLWLEIFLEDIQEDFYLFSFFFW